MVSLSLIGNYWKVSYKEDELIKINNTNNFDPVLKEQLKTYFDDVYSKIEEEIIVQIIVHNYANKNEENIWKLHCSLLKSLRKLELVYNNFIIKIIIVDDGSTDNSYEIINKLKL